MMTPLNEKQLRAARAETGVTLLVAGAGTGKTRTLVEKARNLLASGICSAEELLLLTFSRKAALELRERIAAAAGDGARGLFAGTFHSLSLRIIAEGRERFLQEAGYARFPKILDDDAGKALLREFLRERLERFQGLPVEFIARLLDPGLRVPATCRAKLASTGIAEALARTGEEYAALKQERCVMDFNDLMSGCTALLRGDPELRARLVARWRYLLVDEFQDTAGDDFELLRLLLPERDRNLFAVGDDWQAIYGFRRARIEYILRMRSYFPEARILKLDRNYRSRPEIVRLSNRFLKQNRRRTGKTLVASQPRGGRVRLYRVRGFGEEAALVKEIVEGAAAGGIAILYRNNWQGALLDDAPGASWLDARGVRRMTIHASKGLEFREVIVTGIAAGVLPDPAAEIEEERRLLYVALTRAAESLHLVAHLDAEGALAGFGAELQGFLKFQKNA